MTENHKTGSSDVKLALLSNVYTKLLSIVVRHLERHTSMVLKQIFFYIGEQGLNNFLSSYRPYMNRDK